MNNNIKIMSMFLIFTAIFESGFSAEDSYDKDYKPFLKHLSYLGYDLNASETQIVAKHPRWMDAKFRKYKGGIVITSFLYPCKELVKNDPKEFFEFINRLNRKFTVSRAIIEKDNEYYLVFAAWYPGSYDKNRFVIFIDSWNYDTSNLFLKDTKKLEKYLK